MDIPAPIPTRSPLSRYLPTVALWGFTVLVLLVVALWLGVNLYHDPKQFYELSLIGLTNGAIYGLVALGYSLVYGILELINFAHGDVVMLGAMLTASMVPFFGITGETHDLSFWLWILAMLFIAMGFCAVLNTSIELVAYRRLRNAPRLAPLITAIGMSYVLQNVGLLWKGARPVSVPSILPTGDVPILSAWGVHYTWNYLIVILFTIPVLIGLVLLVQRTRQGKAMRATAQDADAAAMMGINVNRTISFTFFVAGALAGAGALLYALYATNVRFYEGFRLGLYAFTAAVLGGIGNLAGAVLGALVIGFVASFSDGFQHYNPGSDWTESIIFAVLIVILVLRPEGLLGERTPEGA